ncbi:MAG: BTAD domain-containing putative transcriptional regulator, partial [Actinomycetota bacterium]
MELGVLGPLEARAEDGQTVELGPRKQRLLLLALLVRPGTPRSTDQLIDDVWGDDPPGDPRSSLRAYLSNLRKILEPHRASGSKPTMLVRRGNGYVLSVDAATIDAVVFEREVAEARTLGCTDESVALLACALGRWRGDAFADAAYDDFAAAEAARLTGVRDETTELLADSLIRLGRSVEAITVLDEWIARSPYDEGARRRLATAQYAAGRQADALRTLADTRQMMLDELGLDPSPEVADLERRILDQDPSLLDGVGSSPASPPGVLSGPASTSQVAPAGGPPGRAAEFATMRAALERVSQTGAGETLLLSAAAGVGKTRLVEELVGPAASTGTTVVWSRCDEGASNLPLWPWASGLRDLIDGRDPDEVEALLDADRGALASFVPGLTDTAPLIRDDPSQRYQAFDSTMRVLRRLADTAPVIWAIEDLHWADAASREMAVLIARRLADVPILLVITARDHDLDHPTIAELIQVPMTTHLALGHLDVDGVVELVQVTRPDVG